MFEGFAQFAAHSRDLLLGGKDDGVGVERGFEVFPTFVGGGPSSQIGSNAVAIGWAGTRGRQRDEPGILLGNPHFAWSGPDRFYEMQLTIPGVLNVEGAGLYGVPLVMIGFTSTMAWSLTVSRALPVMPYQLTLVAGHPTEYVYNGKPTAMTSRKGHRPGAPAWRRGQASQ